MKPVSSPPTIVITYQGDTENLKNLFLGSDLKNAIADTGKSVIEEIDFNSSNYADLIDSAYAY